MFASEKLAEPVAEKFYQENRLELFVKKTTIQERCANHSKKSLLNKNCKKKLVKKLRYKCVARNSAIRMTAKKQQIEMLSKTLVNQIVV